MPHRLYVTQASTKNLMPHWLYATQASTNIYAPQTLFHPDMNYENLMPHRLELETHAIQALCHTGLN
jgi:hypothetical protein